MPDLDEALKIDGVVAAGEFHKDGTLVDSRPGMDMSVEMAAPSAQFCASVSMLFDTLGGASSQVSGMPWSSQQGWVYSGGEYTVAVGGGGTKGVFVETAKADFNQLLGALAGER